LNLTGCELAEIEFEVQGIDMKRGVLLFGGDTEAYLSVLRSFAANTPATISKLRDVSESNLKEYVINVHGLKGSCSSIGAVEISAIAADLEKLAQSGGLDSIVAINNKFLDNVEKLVATLQKRLDELDSKCAKPIIYAPGPEMTVDRKKIFVVDDDPTILTACKSILKPYYEVYPTPSVGNLLLLIGKIEPDLILLDVEMPELSGYEAARILKNNINYKDIPIMFISARSDTQSEMEGLRLGAVDYIIKPFVGELLIRRIKSHLALIGQKKELEVLNATMQKIIVRKTDKLLKLQNAIMNIVADLVECRDQATGGHITRTQGYLSCFIEELVRKGIYTEDISKWDKDFLVPSAQLHDIGKIGIDDAILRKPDKLTPEEYEIIKTHVQIGIDTINRMEREMEDHSFFRHAKIFAGTHHERWDGKGYPKGLCGLTIPLEGRLMAIVDVYDALISERPYKKALAPQDAHAIIINGRGTHFDPGLIDIFSNISDDFANITTLRLLN